MKKLLLILCVIGGLLSGCSKDDDKPFVPKETEVTLFDKKAEPIAYINYVDDDLTIYMWDGTPVAYLEDDELIYHFNGQFLGWYMNGIIYNKYGYAVAAKKGVVRGEIKMNETYAELELKGLKHLKPIPYVQSLQPQTPLFKDEWSVKEPSLARFFLAEVTLFDKDKKAVAYIAYGEESTIYMWNGTPVAYVEQEDKIYHFDGHFLGWLADGIVYDKEGYAVAAQKKVLKGEISMIIPQMEPVKSMKRTKPKKEIQVLAPTSPHFRYSWSVTSLTDFLLSE